MTAQRMAQLQRYARERGCGCLACIEYLPLNMSPAEVHERAPVNAASNAKRAKGSAWAWSGP